MRRVGSRYEYGTLTPHLFKLQEGDSLNVRGPYGGIKYNANEHDTMLFIGAGTGLTPLLQAITIALANNDDNTRLVFAYVSIHGMHGSCVDASLGLVVLVGTASRTATRTTSSCANK